MESINTLLRKENQKLKKENTIIKNSNKNDKTNNTHKIDELETQVKKLQKSLTEANRKNAKKPKGILKPQMALSESGQMTEDDIDFRAENNSNFNWELGLYDDFRDFKGFVTMKFQEIKQKMAKITSDKTKQPLLHPTSRNNETFLNTKLGRKASYIKQGTLTKEKETSKQKGQSFPVINKYPERGMLFHVRPGALTYKKSRNQGTYAKTKKPKRI